jgi:AhpD family alkylhydroperoxidase
MSHRPALNTALPDAYKSVLTLSEQCDKAAADAGISPLTVELLRIRASQINGCAFCLRMHVRDALAKGETTDRIAVVPAWRETAYFTDEERAALAIAEEITDIANPPRASDAELLTVLTSQQIAVLRWQAVTINAFNRIAISSHYKVGP